MPHKIAQEVTGEELLSLYNIVLQSSDTKIKSWVKAFMLKSKDYDYSGRLHWDEDNGYEIFWDTNPAPQADRPEFEYILDSLTDAGF